MIYVLRIRREIWYLAFKSGLYWWPLRVDSNLYTLLDLHRGYNTFTDLASRILPLRPRAATPGLYVGRPDSGRPRVVESRRIARTRLAFRRFGKMSSSAIRRFGDLVIPRDQSVSIWPDRAQRCCDNAGVTRLHIFIIPSKDVELVGIADSCRSYAVLHKQLSQ